MEQLALSAQKLALRHGLCASCLQSWSRFSLRQKCLQNSDRIQRRFKGYIAPPGGQARPIDGFYAELLKKPGIIKQPPLPSDASPPEPVPLHKAKNPEAWAKAQQVFGNREESAIERKKQMKAATQTIAGIDVPPRPTEPDNCCMSGCVNCVWDMYRDEMEEWAAKSTEARAQMQAWHGDSQDNARTLDTINGTSPASSMDDDGGGSETNWDLAEAKADLFDDIPVGIREFMRTEKKLKQKHRAGQTSTAA